MGIRHRVYRRHDISLRVYLHIDHDWVQGRTVDVSRRGLFVRIDRQLKVGENVRIRVEMTDGRMLPLVGTVRRVQIEGDAGPGLGIELIGTSPDAQARWDAFVLGVGPSASARGAEDKPLVYHGEQTDVLEQQMLRDQIQRAREQAHAEAPRAGERHGGTGRRTVAEMGGRRQGVPQLVVLPGSSEEVRSLARHVYERSRIYLQTRKALRAGDPVSVILVHPDTDAEFALQGRVSGVVRSESGAQIGLRVRFDPLRPDRATQFESFVEIGEPLALGGASAPAERAEMLRLACRRTPERARPFAELGLLLLLELGDVDASRVALQRANELDRDREDIPWALATIAALENDRVAAVGFARQARDRALKHQRPARNLATPEQGRERPGR